MVPTFFKRRGTHAKHGSEGIPEGIMAITKKDVSRVADLARLALTTEESGLYTIQLGRILDHVEKLSELDTKGVPPTTRPAPLGAGTPTHFSKPLRDDATVASLNRDEALANAPEKEKGCFKVPQIIE